eukprot:5535741-Prymnesium_polylepis.1
MATDPIVYEPPHASASRLARALRALRRERVLRAARRPPPRDGTRSGSCGTHSATARQHVEDVSANHYLDASPHSAALVQEARCGALREAEHCTSHRLHAACV